MKRNQVLGVVIDAIFAKTSEFDDIEDIKEDSNHIVRYGYGFIGSC